MSESNHNQSFDDGDTNDFQGSPSSSRASSPAPSSPPPSHIQPFFSSEQPFPPHIKAEPKTEDFIPVGGNGYAHQNFFANFLEKRFQTMDPNKPNLVQKPVPMFSPHLPAFIREKLEAAVSLPNAIYPGFHPHPSLFQAHPGFHFHQFDHLPELRTTSEHDGQVNSPEAKVAVNNDERD